VSFSPEETKLIHLKIQIINKKENRKTEKQKNRKTEKQKNGKK
jgi:hypothetical protein